MSRFDKVTGEWTIYKQADFLADNDVRAITRDTEGNLWMATVAGISVYAPKTRTWEIIAKEDGLPTPYITSIGFGYQPSAVSRQQDSDQPSADIRQQENGEPPQTSLPITDGFRKPTAIWVGTDRGLGTRAYMGSEWTFHTPQNRHQAPGSPSDSSLETGNWKLETPSREAFVTAVGTEATQSNPVIWIGTSLGPAMYDPTSQKWTQLALPDAPKNPLILSVLVRDKSVWFGGTDGVWRYSIADKKMQPANDGLPNPYVNVLLSTGEKGEEMIWAGRVKVSRDMTIRSCGGHHCPLTHNYPPLMSQHSPFEMVYSGSGHPTG